MTEEELRTFDPMEIDPNSPEGYFLVVSLEYPASIHDETADLPLMPEPLDLTEEMHTMAGMRREETMKTINFRERNSCV